MVNLVDIMVLYFSPGVPSWAQVAVVQRIWVLILIDVPGEVKIGWELNSFKIGQIEENFIEKSSFDNFPINFETIFENTWNIYTINQSIIVENYIDKKIFITSITPDIINIEKWRLIVLQWEWFNKIISVQLNNNIVFENTAFNIINDNILSITIPKEINPWIYHFNIMDTSSIYEIKEKTIQITSN